MPASGPAYPVHEVLLLAQAFLGPGDLRRAARDRDGAEGGARREGRARDLGEPVDVRGQGLLGDVHDRNSGARSSRIAAMARAEASFQ